jgi:hypothetical protein
MRFSNISRTKKPKPPRNGFSLRVNSQTPLGVSGMADHKTLSPQVGLSLEPRSGHAQEGYSGEIYEQASREGRRKEEEEEEEEEKREREKKKEGGEPGRIKQQSCEGKEEK